MTVAYFYEQVRYLTEGWEKGVLIKRAGRLLITATSFNASTENYG